MKKIKIFWFVLFLFFIVISSLLFWEKYINYHNLWLNKEKELISNINSFSLDKINNISWVTVKNTPDTELLNDIVYLIDSAKKRVFIEVYILTDKKIQKALKRAYNKWIDVKVLLEKNVYKAPYLNKKSYYNLQKYWINVKWSNSQNYVLNHTKLSIIDDLAIIATWNYSYSTFKYNREFFTFITNKYIFNDLLNIFNNDFDWIKYYNDNEFLILSPYNTRTKFLKLLWLAKGSIKIYSQNFSDDIIADKLIKISKKGIKIDIIFPSIKKIKSNTEVINKFKKNNINCYILEKPYIHAKSIIIDNNILYLWSINFSSYSIDKNREVWIIINDKKIIEYIINLFNKDKLLIN